MNHFPVQCVILVSWTFCCFYHTEVFRCVAGAPKQQHFQKQMRVLAALSALENSLYCLFQFLLEQILSGFATGLRFTCFSITNICFLIFGQRLIFKISIYFECLANITQLCFLGWAQIICTTPQNMKSMVKEKKKGSNCHNQRHRNKNLTFHYGFYDIWCFYQLVELCE